jgi:hypothetical protein
LSPFVVQLANYPSRFSDPADAEKERLYESHFDDSNRRQAMRDFARLNVYVADSNVVKTVEQEDYATSQLLADIGGQLGLWVGVSVITLAEMLQLVFDLLRYAADRYGPYARGREFSRRRSDADRTSSGSGGGGGGGGGSSSSSGGGRASQHSHSHSHLPAPAPPPYNHEHQANPCSCCRCCGYHGGGGVDADGANASVTDDYHQQRRASSCCCCCCCSFAGAADDRNRSRATSGSAAAVFDAYETVVPRQSY